MASRGPCCVVLCHSERKIIQMVLISSASISNWLSFVWNLLPLHAGEGKRWKCNRLLTDEGATYSIMKHILCLQGSWFQWQQTLEKQVDLKKNTEGFEISLTSTFSHAGTCAGDQCEHGNSLHAKTALQFPEIYELFLLSSDVRHLSSLALRNAWIHRKVSNLTLSRSVTSENK